MERVEEHMGVEKDVSSFVLPVGATINMDGYKFIPSGSSGLYYAGFVARRPRV